MPSSDSAPAMSARLGYLFKHAGAESEEGMT
jgi:hypothetical protein